MGNTRIFKYVVPVNDEETAITLPWPATIVYVGSQGDPGEIVFWAQVESELAHPTVTRTFRVFGTGHEIPPGYSHRGTVQVNWFVWHLFEKAHD